MLFLGDCEGRGYRSNGVYETGLPGGMCGYGTAVYYLCPTCRDAYLLHYNQEQLDDVRSDSAKRTLARTSAPDLLGALDKGTDGECRFVFGPLFPQLVGHSSVVEWPHRAVGHRINPNWWID